MDFRYVLIPVLFVFLSACFSGCSSGITTGSSRPTNELPELTETSEIPAEWFREPVIAVFQTRFAPYPDDRFQPEITFAVWDDGSYLLKENRNYRTGSLSDESMSFINQFRNNAEYQSCLSQSLPGYFHTDLYTTILSTATSKYKAESSFRLIGPENLDDISDFQSFTEGRGGEHLLELRKMNNSLYEHLKQSTSSATVLSLSEASVSEICRKWMLGPRYLSPEEIKEIIQGGYGPPYITNDISSKTD
ncbi:hypothetical protein Pan153_11850 [Gimesia panareensis]|uniref:Lipoprotein n=1 Tax=Gimesia panareensis TaxID=2527978 RepID=A0A518FJM7_9PLAN|nr:hypothetical protein [Gimesia panareensis]QDV16555.1 hypothetical protein Pan153_11850 [Gimesia panareensis]